MPDSPKPVQHLPLKGKRILVTRPDDENNPAFLQALRTMGAEVLHVPLIEVAPSPFDWPDFVVFDWLFFTSKNAVKALASHAEADALLWKTLPMACVGPATEQALIAHGLSAAFVSPVYEAESAARIFMKAHTVAGLRIFWPCGNLANPRLKTTLETAGAKVTAWPVYETCPRTGLTDIERQALSQPFDLAVFTSPSAVGAFHQIIQQADFNGAGTGIACLGPRTTQAALDMFGRVAVQANPYTLEALSQAIHTYFEQTEGRP